MLIYISSKLENSGNFFPLSIRRKDYLGTLDWLISLVVVVVLASGSGHDEEQGGRTDSGCGVWVGC